jgi:transcriptional regulator with XRE-family HTH domain
MSNESDQWRAIGERLKKAREFLELTQDDAARAVGISRPSLSQIENGHRKVDALELTKFARIYGQSVELLSGSETSEIPEAVKHLARATRDLSEKDRGELMRFAEYLQTRSKKDESDG